MTWNPASLIRACTSPTPLRKLPAKRPRSASFPRPIAGSTTCMPSVNSSSATSTSGACWRSWTVSRTTGRRRSPARPVQPVIAGIVLLRLHPSDPSVPYALNAIDRELGEGIATPDHVLTVAGGVVSGCPATEPEEVYDQAEPYPSACQDSGGRGVLIYMTDTGLLK